MTEDNKNDKSDDKDEITIEEKAGRTGDRKLIDKHESEQPKESEIQEHPEH